MKQAQDLIAGGELILTGEVLLDDYVVWMWEEDVFFNPALVRSALALMPDGPITVRINSHGGHTSAGEAIRSMIAERDRTKGAVTMIVEGVAMSAASLILMGASRRLMTSGSLLMIHNPSGGAWGEADDLRKQADVLDLIANVFAGVYADASGQTAEAVLAIMAAETWYGPDEAVAAGFAHAVHEAEAAPTVAAPALIEAARAQMKSAAQRVMARRISGDNPRPHRAPGSATANVATIEEVTIMSGNPAQTVQAEDTAVATEITTPAAAAAEVTEGVPDQSIMRAERMRAQRITDAVAMAGLPTTMAAELIADGVAESAALEKITAMWKEKGDVDTPMQGRQSAKMGLDAREKFVMGAELALMAKVGLGGERNEFTSMSLSELARASLEISGERVTMSDKREMVGRAFTMAGMHTTSDFANVLSSVAGKAALKGWEEAEETFHLWTTKGILTDFKPTKRVGAGNFAALPEVKEGADYTYGTVGDRGETIALATYGRLLRISRQAIINDDLSILGSLPRKMGRAAKVTIGNLVYAILTGNPVLSDGVALFHAASHRNLAGTPGTLSVDTFAAGRAAMMKQYESADVSAPLNIRPAYLIVPAALETMANVLMTSTVDPTATKGHATNPVAGASQVVADARLDAASATAWYLAANPAMHDTIEVAYLDGVESPYLEEQTAWTSDGVEMKVRMDAGVAPLDFRTLYKNAGA